jgi:hypothetical protein
MSNTGSNITPELIGDYVAGRLGAEDEQLIEEASITTKESRLRGTSIRE